MTLLSVLIFIITVVADRLVKLWAQTSLAPVVDIPIWEGVFHLHYAENRGAAFSMLQGATWFFIIITVAALIGMIFVLFRVRKHRHWTLILALTLIASGALGNLIDRITLGYVVDMFYFKLINFAIFNVADACITIGAIFYFIYILFFYEKLDRAQRTGESGANE